MKRRIICRLHAQQVLQITVSSHILWASNKFEQLCSNLYQHVPIPVRARTRASMRKRRYVMVLFLVAVSASPVRDALLQVLCSANTTYEVTELPGRGGGLFAQLNYIAQQVTFRTLKGQRPAYDVHARTRLKRYGNDLLSTHFLPIPCTHVQRHTYVKQTMEEALAMLRSAPRYLVVSHIVGLLYRPRATDDTALLQLARHFGSIDLAIHVRRGDKLNVPHWDKLERIKVWDVPAILDEVAKHVRPNGTVLIASDDDAFTREVNEQLSRLGYVSLRLGNDHQRFDKHNKTIEAALVCDATCVAPRLALKQAFARARMLMVSTRSNVGSHLLSCWGAANADAAPRFVDLDGGSSNISALMINGKYFCDLAYGSRCGMCNGREAMQRERCSTLLLRELVKGLNI